MVSPLTDRAARSLTTAAIVAGLAATSGATELGIRASLTGSTSLENVLPPNPRPDVSGAVGPAHFVELLNARYAVYDKATGDLLDSGSHVDFWSRSGAPENIDYAFDPRILYDVASERWFAAAITFELVGTDSWIAVAVSHSSDPTDGWTGFHIDADPSAANWLDSIALGIDADAVYVETIRQQPVTELGLGLAVVVLPKADLTDAVPSIAGATILAPSFLVGGTGAQAAVNLDGGGPPMHLHSNQLSELRGLDVLGPVATPALGPRPAVPVDPLPRPPDAAQPGPKPDLAILSGLQFSANMLLQDGSLWAVQGVDVDGRAAIRWFELDPLANAVVQSGTIADPELDFYMPSIAVNESRVAVIGFTGSSESVFPSAYAVAGENVAGQTVFGEPVLLRAGTADYEVLDRIGRNGWGDFSTTVVDPSDPLSFWTFQEFVIDEDVWGISITHLAVPEPGQVVLVAAGGLALLGAGAARR